MTKTDVSPAKDEPEEKVTSGGELEPEWLTNLNDQFQELSDQISDLIDKLDNSKKPPTPTQTTSDLEAIQSRLNKLESSLPGTAKPESNADGHEKPEADEPPQARPERAKRGLFRKNRRR